MERCKTCKHFIPKSVLEDGKDTNCTNPLTTYEYVKDGIAPKDNTIRFQDYEGYAACLIVGENFGCVNHEPK